MQKCGKFKCMEVDKFCLLCTAHATRENASPALLVGPRIFLLVFFESQCRKSCFIFYFLPFTIYQYVSPPKRVRECREKRFPV